MPTTFREQQARFGPYYFGPQDEGGGSGPGASSVTHSAATPSITNSSPTSFSGLVASAVPGANNSLGKAAIGFGTKALGTLMGVPTAPVTMPITGLLALSQLAHRYGLVGQDTSGLASDSSLASMNQGGPINNATFAALAQGLGLSNAQLAAISAKAPFGRGDQEPAPPAPSPIGLQGLTDEGATAAAAAAADAAGAVAAGADAAGVAAGIEDKGGYIGRKPRPTVDGKHVMVKALKTEYVVNPKATKLHRGLLDAINSGATRTDLARMMKASK